MSGSKPRKDLPPIAVGSVWTDLRVRFIKSDRLTQARVMAVAENYVMARFPHCMPFVMGEAEFRKGFALATGRATASVLP